MKATAERDISEGGPRRPTPSRPALVDEYHLFVNTVLVGGGISCFPHDTRLGLELLDERRFSNGVVLLRYASRT